MSDLKRFIDEQRSKKKSHERHVDWEKRKQRWLNELEKLFANIRHSLIDAGLDESAFTSTSHAIQEETLGDYIAAGLRVNMPTGVVDFIPVGSVIIGGFGRVDVIERGRGEKIKLIAQEPDEIPAGEERKPSYESAWIWKVYPGVGARGGFAFDDKGLVRLLELIMGE